MPARPKYLRRPGATRRRNTVKTQKHRELSDAEAEAIVAAFDDHADDDYEVVTNDDPRGTAGRGGRAP
ncbi:MAG: hypothetical protein R2705_01035 [Ilumatobacteraceae bacterium]